MPEKHLQQEIVDLLKELIRIPSVHSRPYEIDRCSEFIRDWLTHNRIPYQFEKHNGVPSILVMPETRKTNVLLMCHFDVVEVDDEAQFDPVEKDGKLFGRGAIDDKYSIAIALILYREQLRRLEKDGKCQDDLSYGLLLTGDEETGGTNGVGKVVESLKTDYFIAMDGGSPDHIVTKEKGVIALRMESRGKAAHAARPWLGESAFDILTEDYINIKRLFEQEAENHWHRTVVLANCKAGNGAANVVPEMALATLNIRYTENDDPEALVQSIRGCCRSHIFVDSIDPVFVSPPSPYLDLLVHHSGGARVGCEHGASDAKYLSSRGVPGAIWGAQGNMSQHTDAEHVNIESLGKVYDSLEGFLQDVQTNGAT